MEAGIGLPSQAMWASDLLVWQDYHSKSFRLAAACMGILDCVFGRQWLVAVYPSKLADRRSKVCHCLTAWASMEGKRIHGWRDRPEGSGYLVEILSSCLS